MVRSPLVALLPVLAAGFGCLGQVEDTAPADPPTGEPTRPPEQERQIPPATTAVPPPARLRLLTADEYRATVTMIFGPEAPVPDTLGIEGELAGYASVAGGQRALADTALGNLTGSAEAIAAFALGDPTRRAQLLACTPRQAVDDACAGRFLDETGRWLWRRPLDADERKRYLAFAGMASGRLGDFWAGLEVTLAALLQSPNFLYRTEIGRPAPGGARVLDGHEMASRLSFMLLGRAPDRALLDKAAKGELDTPAGARAAAEAMLSAPGRVPFGRFFAEWWGLRRLDGITKDSPLMTPTMAASMREETMQLIAQHVFRDDADFRALFTTRRTFVDAALAKLYGLPAGPAGFREVTLPASAPRAGLLGHGSYLAATAGPHETSPTLRGIVVRSSLLCDDIPPPPANVDTRLPEVPPGTKTARDRLEVHMQDPACGGCHRLMDPLGLAFETFDAIGAFRSTDHGLPIRTEGELDGKRFANAVDLGALVSSSDKLARCLVRHLYRYGLGHLDRDAEAANLDRLTKAFTDGGHRFRHLLLAFVTDPAFRLVAPVQ